MGLMLAEPGAHTRCFVEWDEHARGRIIAAQNAGYFAPAPIWDDVTTFDGRVLRGAIDTILAGYPCQPFSHAGQRRGENDERHLWPDIARIIREIEPRWVFLENVAGHVSLGAETVLRELWDMGFTPATGLFSAEEVGAPHERLRWFCVAYKPGGGCGIGGDEAWSRGSGYSDGGDGDLANAEQFDGRCEQQPGGAWGGRPGFARGSKFVADPHGHVASPNRLQPDAGADWRNHAGRCGGDDVADPGRDRRWPSASERNNTNRDNAGWSQGHGGLEQSGQYVDNTPSPRCDAARIGAGSDIEGGQRLSGAGCDNLADARQPGSQGREQPGSPDQRDRAPASGPVAERGRLPLFPPGPGASADWSRTLQSAPHLAPSASARDCFARARNMEANGREWWEAEVEPEFRQLVDGLAARTQPLRILGNGVVPLVAAHAWRTLSAAHGLRRLDLAAAGNDRTATTNEPFRGVSK